MGTTIRYIFQLALLAPVFFASAIHAESLNDLRRELAITAVEDTVAVATKNHVSLFADRDDRGSTYLRWSRDPRLLFSSRGWVLVFSGVIVRSRPGIKESVQGFAEMEISERSIDDKICYFAKPTKISYRSFVGPMSYNPKASAIRIEYCVSANATGSSSQSMSR